MQEEKKKKGIWNKIKNVLFVDDETDEKDDLLPDYTEKEINEIKEEIKEEPKKEEQNINNDQKDILSTVTEEIKEETKENTIPKEENLPDYSEKPSPFLSFDELEFERLTSRVTRNESRVKEPVKEEVKQTYNLPPSSRENSFTKNTMSSVNNTNIPGKKPFSPSPVISPVYGILDKNYVKEDIIDKRTDRKVELDHLDRVRKKAYGDREDAKEIMVEKPRETIDDKIEDLNFEEIKVSKAVIKEEKKEVKDEEDITYKTANKYSEPITEEEIIEEEPIKEAKLSSPLEEELNKVLDNKEEVFVKENKKTDNKKMDDLEKTSTLRILDDIEKELNSIKPINKENKEDSKDQIDENDIFNMISSMYVGGDDEDDND